MKAEEAIVSGKPDAASGAGHAPEPAPGFDGNSTAMFQTRMKHAPLWFCSFLASNSREKLRLRDGLARRPTGGIRLRGITCSAVALA